MNLKSILLGAAAAAAAATGAQAADLPVAPEPVDYVRVCDAFGTGFFYIPGTETCLRVGGRVRLEYRFNDFGDSNNAWDQRSDAGTSTRARAYIRLDARTNTEYGLVRAYIDTYFQNNSVIGGGTGSLSTTFLDKAFIQFGNFTFGRTTSFFDYYTGNAFNGPLSQVWSDVGSTWVAAYTAAFGNGISATLSVEDGTYRQLNTTGHRAPDLVANLRVDQGWGTAQLMGALHEARLVDTASKTKVGYAVGAGVTFKLPMIAAKDSITFQAQYADGAISYVGVGNSNYADAYFQGGQTKTSKAWSVSGGLTHYWTAQWSTNIDASYVKIDRPFGLADLTQWGVAGNLVWEPVSGLIFGGELEYQNVDLKGAPKKDSIAGMFRIQRTF